MATQFVLDIKVGDRGVVGFRYYKYFRMVVVMHDRMRHSSKMKLGGTKVNRQIQSRNLGSRGD